MTIILDAMGSDRYPDPEIAGALAFVEQTGEKLILVGNRDIVEAKLKAQNTKNLPIEFVHAPEVLEMGDKAVESAKVKKQNSMAIGMDLVRTGQGQAFVTAGNTGAALFVAAITLKRLPGVQRPALTAIFPTRKGRCVVLDIGANVECRPEFFPQFGLMGSLYAEKVLGIKNPRVGLLANGEEPGKGNSLVKTSYPIMAKSGLNFIGNVEPKELFAGEVDVVLCDGFTGNVLLKSSEAVARLITDVLREELTASWTRKIGALLIKPAFGKVKKLIDPAEVGAAPLLGINGLAFVGHGRSNARAIETALALARYAVQVDLLATISKQIEEKLAGLNPGV